MRSKLRQLDLLTGILLTLAALFQFTDALTWRYLIETPLGIELNPVVLEAHRWGIAELLKLAIIVWLLAFSALTTSIWHRKRIWPAVVATAMILVGVVGTWSNIASFP